MQSALCNIVQETEDLELSMSDLQAGVTAVLQDASKGAYYVVQVCLCLHPSPWFAGYRKCADIICSKAGSVRVADKRQGGSTIDDYI